MFKIVHNNVVMDNRIVKIEIIKLLNIIIHKNGILTCNNSEVGREMGKR